MNKTISLKKLEKWLILLENAGRRILYFRPFRSKVDGSAVGGWMWKNLDDEKYTYHGKYGSVQGLFVAGRQSFKTYYEALYDAVTPLLKKKVKCTIGQKYD